MSGLHGLYCTYYTAEAALPYVLSMMKEHDCEDVGCLRVQEGQMGAIVLQSSRKSKGPYS